MEDRKVKTTVLFAHRGAKRMSQKIPWRLLHWAVEQGDGRWELNWMSSSTRMDADGNHP